MVKGLMRFKGLDIHVITANTCVSEERDFIADNINIYIVPAPKRFGNITLYSDARKRISKKIKMLKPDLVHTHMFGYYTLAVFDSGHKKVIVSTHGMPDGSRQGLMRGIVEIIRDIAQDYMYKACSNRAENVIVNSLYAKKILGESSKRKVYELDNPVSEAFFNIGKDGAEEGRILFAGAICGQKGIMDILSSAELLKDYFKGVSFRIAGPVTDNDFYLKAIRYAKENGLGGFVHFLGQLDESSLEEEYRKAAIFIFPSHEDVAPMAVLQAMASGKAIVASNVGGIPYIIDDGINGFLVKRMDANALAEKISLFLKDRTLRKEFGSKAREKAFKDYRIEVVTDGLYKIYQDVMSKKD
jgi:glycosyltransferase involved in cell wall biosynthesis